MSLNLNSVYENALDPLANFLIWKAPGSKFIPAKWVINSCKGGTLPLCIALMYQHNNFSYSACTITALHGSYGLIWVLKDAIMPDPAWETPLSVMGAISIASSMMLYWSAAFIVISTKVVIPPPLAAFATILYALGVVTMMCADAQKYFVLKIKKGLISDGWFETCRNTNFLGEIIVYASFCVCARHYLPWIWCLFVWTAFFGGRFYLKDKSFAKKPGGVNYIESTSILLPVSFPFLPSIFTVPAERYVEPADEGQQSSTSPSPSPKGRQGGSTRRRK